MASQPGIVKAAHIVPFTVTDFTTILYIRKSDEVYNYHMVPWQLLFYDTAVSYLVNLGRWLRGDSPLYVKGISAILSVT